ncbi:MAG: hypothetical protein LW720_14220 [Pirellula sp.]|nr:hypothetical protein [Pirellula sp.]
MSGHKYAKTDVDTPWRSLRSLRQVLALAGLSILAFLGACLGCGFGPRSLVQTRLQYNEAVKTTSEEQFLLNIVRLRYTDTPSSLAISNIADQQELASELQAIPFFLAGAADGFRSQALPQASLSRASRPTLSYTPLDDEEYTRRLFTPISLNGAFYLSRTTWPIATVFRLYLENLNWVSNAETASGPTPKCAPDYAQFLEGICALQELQDAQLVQLFIDQQEEILAGPFPDPPNASDLAIKAVEMELEVRKEPQGFCLIRKTNQPMLAIDPRAKLNTAWDTFCRCFHVDPEVSTLKITTEELPPFSDPNGPRLELLDLETRSLLQALFFVSHGIDVPKEHIVTGKVPMTCNPDGTSFDWRQVMDGLFHVHCVKSKRRPEEAYVAVRYEDYWYYIDHRDRDTKATFALLLEVSRLELQSYESEAPLLTIPLGRYGQIRK